MRQCGMRVQYPLNQGFDFAAAGFLAEQARLHHFGIVKHQHIARYDIIG